MTKRPDPTLDDLNADEIRLLAGLMLRVLEGSWMKTWMTFEGKFWEGLQIDDTLSIEPPERDLITRLTGETVEPHPTQGD